MNIVRLKTPVPTKHQRSFRRMRSAALSVSSSATKKIATATVGRIATSIRGVNPAAIRLRFARPMSPQQVAANAMQRYDRRVVFMQVIIEVLAGKMLPFVYKLAKG